MLDVNRLENLISKRKLSKKEVLERCNITRPTLDKILRGGDFNVSTLEALAHGLNVNISYLFGEEVSQTVEAHDNAQAAGHDINNNGICSSELDRLQETISHLEQRIADKENTIAAKNELIEMLKQK
jgi:transcriptional regulator with XRE-family HTH domain